MPKLQQIDASDPSAYVPPLADAASEAIARLRFVENKMLNGEIGRDFDGYDQAIVSEQIKYVFTLLQEALDSDERRSTDVETPAEVR